MAFRLRRDITPTVQRPQNSALDSYLHLAAGGCDLDIACAQAHTVLESGGHDGALENELVESVSPFASHPHDYPPRAAPNAIANGLEVAGHQVPDLIRRRGRRFHLGPVYRFGRLF